jgi:hypothetical protein
VKKPFNFTKVLKGLNKRWDIKLWREKSKCNLIVEKDLEQKRPTDKKDKKNFSAEIFSSDNFPTKPEERISYQKYYFTKNFFFFLTFTLELIDMTLYFYERK